MAHTSELDTFNHHPVIDPKGKKVGTVVDLVSDRRTLEPQWLVVDPGVFRAAHYVPVEGAYHSSEGDVVIPFERQIVMQAPRASRDHIVTAEIEREIIDHYGIAVG